MKNMLYLLLALTTVATTQDECGGTGEEEETPTPSGTEYPATATPGVEETATPDPDGITHITLKTSSIVVNGPGAVVNGTQVTITAAGTYQVSGTLADGQLVVDTADLEDVHVILSGASITCATQAPLNIVTSEHVYLTLADGTHNFLTDGTAYVYADPTADEPDAALFSKEDLTILGSGYLEVDAHYADGIASKDGLTIQGGNITVTALDDAIRGKDYVLVTGGTLTLTAGGDAIKATHDTDATLGYVVFEDGNLTATAGGDGISAETNAIVTGGTLHLTTGGGATVMPTSLVSTKGIKGVSGVSITGGVIQLNTSDDGIHSNGNVALGGGTLTIATGDDGVHADGTLTADGGTVTVTKSYEGLEGGTVTINNGTFHLTSSDDGINVAGGNDGSGNNNGPGQPYPTGTYNLYLNGGYIYVLAGGDGIDSNGSFTITGGTILVNGPTDNGNGALDYGPESGGVFKITGGFLLAAGSAGMATAPGSTSTQYSVMINGKSAWTAGSLFNLQTTAGSSLFTFAPKKTYQSIVFSAPSLAKGTSYNAYNGGSSTGTATDGLYQGGTYTPGTKYTSFTISSITTTIK